MEQLIASVVSLIVLVPIVYFLPLGLTNKGKGLVVAIAFFYANLGFLANTNLALWQTALIILLLTIVTVYILDKRFNRLIFSSSSSKDKDVELTLEKEDEASSNIQTADSTRVPVAPITVETFEHIEVEEPLLEKVKEEDEIPVLQGMEEVAATMEMVAQEEIHETSLIEQEENPSLEADEEIIFLSNREELLEELQEDEPSSNTDELEATGYMSEIEQLLESELLDEDLQTIEEIQQVEEVHSPLELLEDDIIPMEDEEIPILELAIAEAELAVSEETASIPLQEEADPEVLLFEEETKDESGIIEEIEQEETSFLEDDLTIEDEDDSLQEIEQIDELENEFEELDELEPVLQMAEEVEDIEDEHIQDTDINQEEKTALQQQLFHTMVSQLHLMKNQMKPNEYEELIIDHFHPDLPAQDYYTFVSLLIEHYISQKELGKLQGLLTNLEGKFVNYPILDMEIQFLYQQYCENAR